jgi:hypothetical protein
MIGDRHSTQGARGYFLSLIPRLRESVLLDLFDAAYRPFLEFLTDTREELLSIGSTLESDLQEDPNFTPETMVDTAVGIFLPGLYVLGSRTGANSLDSALRGWSARWNLTSDWCLNHALITLREHHLATWKTNTFDEYNFLLAWDTAIGLESVALLLSHPAFTGDIAEELCEFRFKYKKLDFTVPGPFSMSVPDLKAPRKSRAKAVVPRRESPEVIPPDSPALFAGGYRFARLLVWDFSYYVDEETITIHLVHVSHMKADVPLRERDTPREWAEQLPAPIPSITWHLPRSWFKDEIHIKEWMEDICARFDDHLHPLLTFEIGHHFSDLLRCRLPDTAPAKRDVNEIIRDHINGGDGQIGSLEFLRILLGARGPGNKSPANEHNLPALIRGALSNLRMYQLNFAGVNKYLEKYHPTYASASGDALRKLCKKCGIDFVALVREEKARRGKARPEN